MAAPLRLLILEDRPTDAELMVRSLHHAGFAPTWQRVETEADYLAQLHANLDVVLADYTLPQFDALRALCLLQVRSLDIPFIVVTGTVSEEAAVACMKQGAADYLLKDRLVRLGPAVQHALDQKRLRDEKRQTEAALRVSEARYRSLVEHAPVAIYELDLHGRLVSMNPIGLRMMGATEQNPILGRTYLDMVACHERQRVGAFLTQACHGQEVECEYVAAVGKAGPRAFASSFVPVKDGRGALLKLMGITQDITERKWAAEKALRDAHQQTAQLLEAIPSILIGINTDTRVTWWNATAERAFGTAPVEVLGRPLDLCRIPWDKARVAAGLAACRATGEPVRIDDLRFQHCNGRERFLGITITPIQGTRRDDMGFLLLAADITERKMLERQLTQAQKLEAVGQLAAGIAHEINTPTQFVGDNIRFLQEAFQDVGKLLEHYGALLQACQAGTDTVDSIREVEALAEAIDVAYLRMEIPAAIEQSLEGIARVATIVRAMKEFSHPGGGDKTAIDLNKAIESTLTVARNEWKYVAEVVTDFDPALPPVLCLAGEFNQVILNMVVNAAHTIAEAVQARSESKGTITISTRQDGDWIEMRIADTGTGIPAAARDRIFDPFFTTKGVGKGTGQGLAIAYDVVVKKHGGTLTFESEVGQGTTFIIRLPLEAPVLEESKR